MTLDGFLRRQEDAEQRATPSFVGIVPCMRGLLRGAGECFTHSECREAAAARAAQRKSRGTPPPRKSRARWRTT